MSWSRIRGNLGEPQSRVDEAWFSHASAAVHAEVRVGISVVYESRMNVPGLAEHMGIHFIVGLTRPGCGVKIISGINHLHETLVYSFLLASQHPIVAFVMTPLLSPLNTTVQSPGAGASIPRGFESSQTSSPTCRIKYAGPLPRNPSKEPYSTEPAPKQWKMLSESAQ